MRALPFIIASLLCMAGAAYANTTEINWTFTRGVDFENVKTPLNAPAVTALKMSGDNIKLSDSCIIHLQKHDYYPGGPFQMLLKSGESEAAITKFMKSSLGFNMKSEFTYYDAEPSACNKLGTNFLISNDQLIAIYGADFFYAFRRADATNDYSKSNALNLKVTNLPFNLSDYAAHCYPLMAKGVPQPSSRCAPNYYYHIASRESVDPLSKMIGVHDYEHGGAGSAGPEYNNPVSHGLHPVFLVFPPMGDVTLVRVDDFEGRQETRDQISGAYLVVKGDKVTDELNEGCDLDAQYVCTADGGKRYKLMPSGHFASVN